MKILLRTLVAGCLAVAAMTAFATSPAMAAFSVRAVYANSSGRDLAQGTFNADTEKISAQDLAKDGKSAVTVYVIEGESQATLWDSNGSSSDAEIRSIPRAEGKSIRIKSCIGEYSGRDIQSCTGWKYGGF